MPLAVVASVAAATGLVDPQLILGQTSRGKVATPAATASAASPMLQPASLRKRAGVPIADSYIVTLKSSAALRQKGAVAQAASGLSSRYGGKLGSVYTTALQGFAVHLTAANAKAMARDSRVASVQQDLTVVAQSTQVNPSWSLDRVDQSDRTLSGTYDYSTDASNANIFIMDTGVRLTQSDFGGRAKQGPPQADNNDCQGHGTAVAGTAAGATWGVAKKANIYSVRVLNCDGAGAATDALTAIDWITSSGPRPAVVNISWATGPQDALDQAIRNSIAAGVTYVIAAGNSNADACGTSPQRVKEAIVVGSSDSRDNRTGWSNYGSCVDIFAPGADIATDSFASDTATTTASGTSLSAPIVTGAAAVYLSSHPTSTPAQVAAGLAACAEKDILGNPGPNSPNLLVNTQCANSVRITNPGRQQTVKGAPISMTKVKASGNVKYSATGLPAGISIDASTGVISGTATAGGTTTAVVTATDQSTGASTFTSFVWEVDLGYGYVKNISGVCADNDSYRTTDGNPIQVWQCQEVWTSKSDGTLVIQGKCMTAADLIVLFTCTGAGTQVWQEQSDGTLRNPASGKCLTAPSTAGHTQLTLTACTGADSQKWTLPTSALPNVVSLDKPGTQATVKGSSVWFKVVGYSQDTTRGLHYSASGLPAGLNINGATGIISGTVTVGGQASVTLTVTDDVGITGTAQFTWEVSDGQMFGLDGTCIDDPNSSQNAGTALQISTCGGWNGQQFFVRSDNRLETVGMCMDTAGGATAAGTAIVLATCGTAATQVWQPQSDGTVRNPTSGRCLAPTSWEWNSKLILVDCSGKPIQQWAMPNAVVKLAHPVRQDFRIGTAVSIAMAAGNQTLTYSATGIPAGLTINASTGAITGTPTVASDGSAVITATDAKGNTGKALFDWSVHQGLITGNGWCIDNYLGKSNDGNAIVVWGCNGGITQLWSVRADGELSAEDKCLTVSGDSTAEGSPIVLYDCRGAGSQIWKQQANGSLLNPASGKCLNAPAFAYQSQFTLAACNGSANQQWALPTSLQVNNPGAQTNRTKVALKLQMLVPNAASGVTLNYSVTGLPAGLSLDPTTGLISGTPTQTGTTTVTVKATDGTNSGGSTFTWAIVDSVGVGVITTADASRCVDQRTDLWVWDCNRSAPQWWTVHSDGRLSAYSGTRCMTPDGDASAAGTVIGTAACGTDPLQVWSQKPDNTLVNTASGLCLTAWSLGYTSSFTLQTCTGTANQQWLLP